VNHIEQTNTLYSHSILSLSLTCAIRFRLPLKFYVLYNPRHHYLFHLSISFYSTKQLVLSLYGLDTRHMTVSRMAAEGRETEALHFTVMVQQSWLLFK